MFGAMDLGVTDDSKRAGHEQAAQIAVTLFAYIAEPVLASTRVLFRHDTDPGREVAPRSEGLWISNGSHHSSGQHRTDAGSFIEPHAHLVGSVPGPDQPVKLQYLLLDPPQLSPEGRQTRTGYLRNSLIVWIGHDIEQLLDPVAPDRCNDSELGKMGPDRIDHRGLLTDEQVARAVQHQATLLLGSLGWHEPHVGPGDCLANGLCVSRVILLPLDVGLHIGRRHQPHGVTQCLQLARPMVRRAATPFVALACRWRSRPQHQTRTSRPLFSSYLSQKISQFSH